MPVIASSIARALRGREEPETLALLRKEVADLCSRFPAYPHGV